MICKLSEAHEMVKLLGCKLSEAHEMILTYFLPILRVPNRPVTAVAADFSTALSRRGAADFSSFSPNLGYDESELVIFVHERGQGRF